MFAVQCGATPWPIEIGIKIKFQSEEKVQLFGYWEETEEMRKLIQGKGSSEKLG